MLEITSLVVSLALFSLTAFTSLFQTECSALRSRIEKKAAYLRELEEQVRIYFPFMLGEVISHFFIP